MENTNYTATTATVGNGRVVHHAMTNRKDIVTQCGAEGRRYHEGTVRLAPGRPVSCGRCSDQPSPVAPKPAPVQTADDLARIYAGRIAEATERIEMYREMLERHPGEASLIASLARAEASLEAAEIASQGR